MSPDATGIIEPPSDPNYLYNFQTYKQPPLEERFKNYRKEDGGWLDNMDDDMLKEAIAYIDHRAEIEVSGNVTKENIARLTNLGVDYVSSGALTHSAPILDLSLKNLHVI